MADNFVKGSWGPAGVLDTIAALLGDGDCTEERMQVVAAYEGMMPVAPASPAEAACIVMLDGQAFEVIVKVRS